MNKFWKSAIGVSALLTTFFCSAQNVGEAIQAMHGERYRTATNIINKVIDENPDEAQNYYYAGYIYVYIGKADSAQYYFDKGIKVNDRSPLNYVGKAYLALNKGNTAMADNMFKKAVDNSRSRNRAVVYNQIANVLLNSKNKNAEKALTYLKKAEGERVRGDNADQILAETQMLLGYAWLDKGNAGKAIGYFNKAMNLNGELKAMLFNKIGWIYLSARNSKAALRAFKKAKLSNPNFAPVYKNLGEVYFTYEHNVAKAKEMYQKYLQLSDISKSSEDRYAAFLYVSKDFDKAIPKIKHVLKNDPDNIVMNRLLGYSLYKTGDYQGSVNAFKDYFKIVKPEKTLSTDYALYGKALLQTGKDSLATKYIFKAVDMDSTQMKMVQDLAKDLVHDKKFKAASSVYSEILNRSKNLNSKDYYAAGRVFLQAKEFTKADSSFTKVIELSPDNYIGYYMMAISKFYQDPEGEKGLAKPYYEKVIELTSSKPDEHKSVLMGAYRYLATYYTKNKNLDKAKSYWEKINALDPGNANAKKFMEYYKQVQDYKKKKQQAEANG